MDSATDTTDESTNTRAGAGKDALPAVLQVLPALEPGDVRARAAVDVAVALAEWGGRSLVASAGGAIERELTRAGAEHVTLPLTAEGMLTGRRNAKSLAAGIAAQGVDLIHAHTPATAKVAAAAARAAGRPWIASCETGPLPRRREAVLARADLVIAPSGYVEADLVERHRVPAERIRLIRPGVDLEVFSAERVTAQRVISRATEWRLPDGLPLVMLHAPFAKGERHDLLLTAIKRLADLEFCCVMIGAEGGETAARAALEKKIEKQGLRSRAFVVASCRDMAAAYMLADVVVRTADAPVAFARGLTEAQAMGRPVVAADQGGVAEQVIDGVTAFLHAPGDPAGLALALHRALTLGKERRDHLRLQAELHARSTFSKDQMCRETVALYRELAAGGQ